MALPEWEKDRLAEAEDTFEALFGYFNTQIALLVPSETGGKAGSDGFAWGIIALLLAALLLIPVLDKRIRRSGCSSHRNGTKSRHHSL